MCGAVEADTTMNQITLNKPESWDEFAMSEQGKKVGVNVALTKSLSDSRARLSRIAELLLVSDSRAVGGKDDGEDQELRRLGRVRLSQGLGCRVEDLNEIAASYGDSWDELVLEERLRLGIDSVALRDATWDSLEGATLRKLFMLVENNSVSNPMELLSIATAANRANRGRRNTGGAPAGGTGMTNITNIGLGFQPGDPDNGVLPAGNLGTIQLSLSTRVQKQLEGTVVKNPDERIIDNVEMLDITGIQSAVDNDSNS